MQRVAGATGTFAVLALLVVLAGCGPYGTVAVDHGCAGAVLGDWSDGSIEGVYPDHCYLAAIDALPEDVRAYTSARDDIARALQARRRVPERRGAAGRVLAEASIAGNASSPAVDRPPSAVILLATIVAAVGAAGIGAYVVRRLRGGTP